MEGNRMADTAPAQALDADALTRHLVSEARRLAPGIAQRAEAAERDRRVADETITEVSVT